MRGPGSSNKIIRSSATRVASLPSRRYAAGSDRPGPAQRLDVTDGCRASATPRAGRTGQAAGSRPNAFTRRRAVLGRPVAFCSWCSRRSSCHPLSRWRGVRIHRLCDGRLTFANFSSIVPRLLRADLLSNTVVFALSSTTLSFVFRVAARMVCRAYECSLPENRLRFGVHSVSLFRRSSRCSAGSSCWVRGTAR